MRKYSKKEAAFLKEWSIQYKRDGSVITFQWRRTEIPQGVWDTRVFTIYFEINPTGNCQMFCASQFEGLLMEINPYIQELRYDTEKWMPLYEFAAEEILKMIMSVIYEEYTQKQMLLLDTVEYYQKRVRRVLKGITRWNPTNTFVYTSSNNNQMRASVVRLHQEKYEDYYTKNKGIFKSVKKFEKNGKCNYPGWGVWKLMPAR